MTTAPADGIERLMFFADARLARLGLSKSQAIRLGFPSKDTLSAARKSATQTHPRLRTLQRIDTVLGWQPGSAAITLLGGTPASLSVRRGSTTGGDSLSGAAVQDLLVTRIRDEIAAARRDAEALTQRLHRLCAHLDVIVDVCDELDAALVAPE